MPEEWKESIIEHIYKKGNKKGCHNYRSILHLPNMYKIISNILLSRLSPYAEENIGLDGKIILGWFFGKWDGDYGLDQAGSV